MKNPPPKRARLNLDTSSQPGTWNAGASVSKVSGNCGKNPLSETLIAGGKGSTDSKTIAAVSTAPHRRAVYCRWLTEVAWVNGWRRRSSFEKKNARKSSSPRQSRRLGHKSKCMPGQDPPLVLEQSFQQFKLSLGQIDNLTGNADLIALQV